MKCTTKRYVTSLLGLGLCLGFFTESAQAVLNPDNEYLDLDISYVMQTAITLQGVKDQTANKLLVLTDERTLYASSASGGYWDVQDTLLEDVGRIEVINGPSGTSWGANAVDGTINIITGKASDTEGGLVRVSIGDKERLTGAWRYGKAIGESTHARACLTYRDSASLLHGTETVANDAWGGLHGGLRLDGGDTQKDSWTVQGGIYTEDANQFASSRFELTPLYISKVPDTYDASGWNILTKWKHQLSKENFWTFQSSYDFSNWDELYVERTHKIFDVDFQHQLQLGKHHDLKWGLAYRHIHDEFDNTWQLLFSPESYTQELFRGFVQDKIMLMVDRMWFTLGSKIEHNDFTGCEVQPSGRLLFKLVEEQTVWTAVSRAVRTPSRIERDARLVAMVIPEVSPFPAADFLWGNQDYDSEDVLVYEFGYRIVPMKQLSLDIVSFYNEYDNLRIATPYILLPTSKIQFENKSSGSSFGFELAADWKPGDWISFQLGYTYLELDLDVNDGESGLDEVVVYKDSRPQHGVSLRSSIDIAQDLQMTMLLRYVDQFAAAGIEALSSQSIVDEYVAPLTDIEQSIYGKLTYSF